MATINDVLNQSLRIMHSLKLTSITCVFDQAIYYKALEIKPKISDLYKPIVVGLDTFHTLCTLISIIGKRFQDAGLRDLCIESGVVAEGSVSALMEGRSYNRAVRFHTRSYEAFRRVTWAGFLPWVESHHPQDSAQINKALEDIGSLADDLQKSTHDHFLKSQAFQVLFERSEEYMEHLRKTNGPLSAFWLSYIDMVELMLHMIRASREGNWTFTTMSKVKTIKRKKEEETIIRADGNVFARMIIIAEIRPLHKQEVLQHPLGPLPSSLATSNGLPRKHIKAQLGRELEKLVQPTAEIPSPSVYVIGGMALIQKLKVSNQMTFGQIADVALPRVLQESGNSRRIDVVLDVYNEISIKSAERDRREEGESVTYKNLTAGQGIRQFIKLGTFCKMA